ncbi:Rv1733c family protein [Microbispora sp. ATCC PTA-5024]|uniref:Rv1733c family protein n=1 Tax=Microbispora sp. ATCC PTA-5024 TaxID=316330 RepID=UPI0012ED2EC9|nr:hypothetical protein [Microbispora sp. ATCC PTA-5024]
MRGTAEWALRRVRLYRPDGNPLRRASDRLEALAALVFLALCVACLGPAAVAGNAVYRSGVAQERAGQWVTATVLAEAPKLTWVSLEGAAAELRTRVAWTVPGRGRVVGEAPVPEGTKPGALVRVWLDPSGRPGDGPPVHMETTVGAVVTGVSTEAVAVGLLLASLALFRALLDRRRFAAWEAEWISVNPRRRRPGEDALP